ncbi:rhomboid family intramembrane serine protease [Microbulbifer sp. OS29]|uniref:Rhomboid family intramembrane serine protease n=1 Tax=Microbulbifer okhotskensis TaxID=2926617 RepID=A0A9X2J3B4_9GAMM|nr:rhomboid family intramembrane serine protease [Microbulbifer okhotskensis]MCO1332848.1 rhomboid family intramembrane serine protease [Microbulbifer okhotskensis]
MRQNLKWVGAIFLALAVIEIINIITGRSLNQFGIVPRSINHLPHIFSAPLLHANTWHFFSNILTLCIFSFLLLQYGVNTYLKVTLTIIITTGLAVWLFAGRGNHLGASSVIYGYFGFLLLAGFISKQFSRLLISIVVGLLYGGLIFGVLPHGRYISWESHLFGFIFGLLAAKIWARVPSYNISR